MICWVDKTKDIIEIITYNKMSLEKAMGIFTSHVFFFLIYFPRDDSWDRKVRGKDKGFNFF